MNIDIEDLEYVVKYLDENVKFEGFITYRTEIVPKKGIYIGKFSYFQLKTILEFLENKAVIVVTCFPLEGSDFDKAVGKRISSLKMVSNKDDVIFSVSCREPLNKWYEFYLLRMNRRITDFDKDFLARLKVVLQQINQAFQVASSESLEIIIPRSDEIIIKFLEDEKVVSRPEISYYSNGSMLAVRFSFSLDYYKSIMSELKLVPDKVSNAIHEVNNGTKVKYKIEYSYNNEIMLNGILVLKKLQFDKENERVFKYLLDNPNKNLSKKEIETGIGHSLGKDFHRYIEQFGFKGPLKILFFEVSNKTIKFKNPVKEDDFQKSGQLPIRIKFPK